MSRLDEPTDPAFVTHIARQVVASHDQGHRCQRCTDTDCDQLGWAHMMLRELAGVSRKRQAQIADGRPAEPDPPAKGEGARR